MEKFDNIRDTLKYTVENLIRKGHIFIINIRGPREIHDPEDNCFQVVAETMPYQNRKLGLTVHLPFDPSFGISEELVRFLECPLRFFFDKYVWSGIPIFALRLGENIDMAERVMLLLLTEVYGYTTGTDFECIVYDEGRLEESDKSHNTGPAQAVAEEGESKDEEIQPRRVPAVKPVRRQKANTKERTHTGTKHT